ncbi:MAG: UbiA family prenyltransferase [Saprospiraceae bacterium]|nr:UbiA family prenyltransferase [Saprospiraceae bacterium]
MVAIILLLSFRLISIDEPTQTFDSIILLVMVVLATLFIMAGGNVINDIFDITADRYNRPHQRYVTRTISISGARRFYYLLCVLALVTSFLVYLKSRNSVLIVILVVTMIVLYLYSSHLKKIPLAGNLTVSILCALTLWLIPIAFEFSNSIGRLPDELINLLSFLSLFAFLLTFIREIVKDRIDITGDRMAGVMTLAQKTSPTQFKAILAGTFILVISLLIYVLTQQDQLSQLIIIYLYGLIGTGLFLLFRLFKQLTHDELKRTSQYLKLYMIQGIFLLALA